MDAPFRDMSETGASPAPDDERAKRRERLAGALKEADAATSLIHLVHIGAYDNFRSTNTNPDDQNLTSHASKAELWDIVRRAQAGEFDAPENY